MRILPRCWQDLLTIPIGSCSFARPMHAFGLGRDRVLYLSLNKRSYRTSYPESSTCPFEHLNATCSEHIPATVNVNDISPLSSPLSPPVCTIFMFLQRAASHKRTLQLDKHKTHCKLKNKGEKRGKRTDPYPRNEERHPTPPKPLSKLSR